MNERATLTRRTFLAGAGAAAAATIAQPALAFAAGGVDPVYRIHPAIGVARVGNAPSSEYFIGPEIPGYGPLNPPELGSSVPDYKNTSGQIKPQAARFRIYEYATVNGTFGPVREVTLATQNVTSIQWHVHLANKKASFHAFEGGQGDVTRTPVVPAAPLRNSWATTPAQRASLDIDPGPRSIAGATQGPVECGLAPGAVGPKKANGTHVIDYLGELRTDGAGRLIVIGGKGKSGYDTATQPPMPHWANNDHWFDDASDGPVTATVTINDGGTPRTIQVDADGGGAWVTCGPPDFAPGIPSSVTGYDQLFDVAVDGITLPPDGAMYAPGGPLSDLKRIKDAGVGNMPDNLVRFEDHIEPQLIAAYNLWFINGLVNAKHNSLLDEELGSPSAAAKSKRSRVFGSMRPPEGAAGNVGTMPKLMGDDPYIGRLAPYVKNQTITRTQHEMLRKWADGNFTVAGSPPPVSATDPAYWSDGNAQWAAHGLDRAALENAVGRSYFPGIEWGWQLRHPALYFEPFRLDIHAPSNYVLPNGSTEQATLGPGFFSRQMAVPWQADFNDCRNEGSYGWWPSPRPTHALVNATDTRRVDWARPSSGRYVAGNRESTHEDMVTNWSKFGFVLLTTVSGKQYYLEKERGSEIA